MDYQLSHATIFNCFVLTTRAIIACLGEVVKGLWEIEEKNTFCHILSIIFCGATVFLELCADIWYSDNRCMDRGGLRRRRGLLSAS